MPLFVKQEKWERYPPNTPAESANGRPQLSDSCYIGSSPISASAGSSNGRIAAFDTAHIGSIPIPASRFRPSRQVESRWIANPLRASSILALASCLRWRGDSIRSCPCVRCPLHRQGIAYTAIPKRIPRYRNDIPARPQTYSLHRSSERTLDCQFSKTSSTLVGGTHWPYLLTAGKVVLDHKVGVRPPVRLPDT